VNGILCAMWMSFFFFSIPSHHSVSDFGFWICTTSQIMNHKNHIRCQKASSLAKIINYYMKHTGMHFGFRPLEVRSLANSYIYTCKFQECISTSTNEGRTSVDAFHEITSIMYHVVMLHSNNYSGSSSPSNVSNKIKGTK